MFAFLKILHKDRPPLERLKELLDLKSPNTCRSYLSVLRAFRAYSGLDEARLMSLTTEEAVAYLSHIKRKKLAPATQRLHLDALRSMWDMLHELKAVKENPWGSLAKMASKSDEQRRPTQLIAPEKVLQMIAGAETLRDRAILCCLFGGALRRAEGRALTLADVSTAPDGTVLLLLQETKAGKSATVGIPDWAGSVVLALIDERKANKAKPGDWLFVEEFKHKATRQMSESSFYRVFKKAARKAGIPGAAPHAARASSITKLLADGFAPYEVAEFSRHSNLDMLKVYDKRRRELSDCLGKKLTF